MDDELAFFNFENRQMRVTDRYGAPWFVGKDVAGILGYANPSEALRYHVADEDKLNSKTLLSLGQRGGWLINESGLYSLILSSKLPNAKAFKRWITSEVLPSIRKSGIYLDVIKLGDLNASQFRSARIAFLINKRNEIDQQIQEELRAENVDLLEKNKALTVKNERLIAKVNKCRFRLKMIHKSGQMATKNQSENT